MVVTLNMFFIRNNFPIMRINYYILGSPVEIETPTHWNLIGCKVADLP